MRVFNLSVLGSILVAGLASGQKLSPEARQFVKVDAPMVALAHVRVIDGTGTPAREHQTMILSKGKIASVWVLRAVI